MKIIFCGLEHENYDLKRGTSFEYNNFYLTLKSFPGAAVVPHFFDRILEVGKRKYNEELLELVRRERPDVVFVFMYTDEISPQTLREISSPKPSPQRGGGTITIAWMADDHWRLHNYSRFWAPYFDWVVTTYSKAPELYAGYGIRNVIRSQWGYSDDRRLEIASASPRNDKDSSQAQNDNTKEIATGAAAAGPRNDEGRDINVSFIGQRTAAREKIINVLRKAGIDVFVRGHQWPEGKISQEGMLDVFRRSKINLNLNATRPWYDPYRLARLFFRKSITRVVPDWHFISNVKSYFGMGIPQIKARPFEIIGRGGFLISGRADDMEKYYEDGKEIVYYNTADDLVEKIGYYLAHNEEREKIARAGQERTMREHTYERRFEEIFSKIMK